MSESSLSVFAPTLDLRGADPCCEPASEAVAPSAPGSRRRKLWELDGSAHCPVIGVCLPIAVLRRLFEKVGVLEIADEDYALHCDAIGGCQRRSPVAEALQREFDRRFALPLRQSDRIKNVDELSAWWQEHGRGVDLPGAVWATISHPRCDTDLRHRLLGDLHMLQHRVGTAERAEQGRLETTLDELARARRTIADLQERVQRQATDHARQLERRQAERSTARAEQARRDATILALTGEIDRLRPNGPEPLPSEPVTRDRPGQRVRVAPSKRAPMRTRYELAEASRRDVPPVADADRDPPDDRPIEAPASGPELALDERAVLCVGGRPASVPLYRRIVEKTGGRFLHHDGGDQQNVARLAGDLAAADLVICQTGCISHDAYWRVKDHCKRTGKPCLFVENPGSASLKRALAGFALVAVD